MTLFFLKKKGKKKKKKKENIGITDWDIQIIHKN